jgi:protein-S-isoprenylcysteine O-methyltransferase Ste14
MNLNNNQRTVFGIGPRWMFVSVIFSLPVILFACLTHPKFVIKTTYRLPFQILGAILAFTGFLSYVVSIRTVLKAFKQDKLVTTGVFGVSRHPIYSSLMIAMIPGISLYLGMPLLLLIPAIMYVTFRFVFMKSEEEALCEIFGEEHLEYRDNVNAIFPTIFPTRR